MRIKTILIYDTRAGGIIEPCDTPDCISMIRPKPVIISHKCVTDHNCQHLPISTESTNSGEGGLRRGSVLFLKMLIYLWNIIIKN